MGNKFFDLLIFSVLAAIFVILYSGSVLAECGNLQLEQGEICDWYYFADESATCETVLGAGYLGELRCSDSCNIDTSYCYKCGDGIVEAAEACDGTNLNGKSCDSIFTPSVSGTLACLSDCSDFDVSNCLGCGNNRLDASLGENCDGEDFGLETCGSILGQGFLGYLRCSDSCNIDIDASYCFECGDSIVNGYETCDNGKQCENLASCLSDVECEGIGDGLCKKRDDPNVCFNDCSIVRYINNSDNLLLKIDYIGRTSDIFYTYDIYGRLRDEARGSGILGLDGRPLYYLRSWDYDLDNNLIFFHSPEDEIGLEYDNGRIVRETNNGVPTTYQYTNERITCVDCEEGATGLPQHYTYDEEGRVSQYSFGILNVIQEFDENGRFSKLINDEGEEAVYNYDENGVLISITGTYFGADFTANQCGSFDNHVYDENCNLINDGNYTYVYDNNGNKIERTLIATGEITRLEYNTDNQLVRVIYPDGSYENHIYDVAGLAVKIVDSSENTYVYLEPGDDNSIVHYDDLLRRLGDVDGNRYIDSADYFAAQSSGAGLGMLSSIAYNWVGTDVV